LSPFTDQPVSYIYGAYSSPAAGAFAAGSFVLLMLSLLAAVMYTGFRWIKGYSE
jgi:hypothetical protein